jgi:hypothetical protein
MDTHGTTGGHKVAQTMALDESWTQEYLAVDKDILTKERVSFTTAHQKTGGDTPKDVDLPFANQTYVATAADGNVTFTDGKGGKIDDAVAKLLASTVDNVGDRDKLGALFGGKSFSKGVAVPLSNAELLALMGSGNDLPASSITLTLADNDGKRARFDIAGTMGGDQNGTHLEATFSGTVTVDLARGRMIDFDLTAEMKMNATQGRNTTEIEMKATARRSVTFR